MSYQKLKSTRIYPFFSVGFDCVTKNIIVIPGVMHQLSFNQYDILTQCFREVDANYRPLYKLYHQSDYMVYCEQNENDLLNRMYEICLHNGMQLYKPLPNGSCKWFKTDNESVLNALMSIYALCKLFNIGEDVIVTNILTIMSETVENTYVEQLLFDNFKKYLMTSALIIDYIHANHSVTQFI